MSKAIIFDSDGVLIDTHDLVNKVCPWLSDVPKWSYDFMRKAVILFYADRIHDKRLKALPGAMRTLIDAKHKGYKFYIITKRPFVFGAKKRLMRQLDHLYGKGTFDERNVYSSFFSKNKAAVIKSLPKFDYGIMIDDNLENLSGMPGNIKCFCLKVWLTSRYYDENDRISFIKALPEIFSA